MGRYMVATGLVVCLLSAFGMLSPTSGAGSNIEPLPEGGETIITDRELRAVGGKLYAEMPERPLLEVLQRLQNITQIEFRVDPDLSGPTVFGSFPEGLPLDEGVQRLLRWTSHAVVSDESGRISKVTVFGESRGGAGPRARADAPEPVAQRAPTAYPNVVIVGGRVAEEEPPAEEDARAGQSESRVDEKADRPAEAEGEPPPQD